VKAEEKEAFLNRHGALTQAFSSGDFQKKVAVSLQLLGISASTFMLMPFEAKLLFIKSEGRHRAFVVNPDDNRQAQDAAIAIYHLLYEVMDFLRKHLLDIHREGICEDGQWIQYVQTYAWINPSDAVRDHSWYVALARNPARTCLFHHTPGGLTSRRELMRLLGPHAFREMMLHDLIVAEPLAQRDMFSRALCLRRFNEDKQFSSAQVSVYYDLVRASFERDVLIHLYKSAYLIENAKMATCLNIKDIGKTDAAVFIWLLKTFPHILTRARLDFFFRRIGRQAFDAAAKTVFEGCPAALYQLDTVVLVDLARYSDLFLCDLFKENTLALRLATLLEGGDDQPCVVTPFYNARHHLQLSQQLEVWVHVGGPEVREYRAWLAGWVQKLDAVLRARIREHLGMNALDVAVSGNKKTVRERLESLYRPLNEAHTIREMLNLLLDVMSELTACMPRYARLVTAATRAREVLEADSVCHLLSLARLLIVLLETQGSVQAKAGAITEFDVLCQRPWTLGACIREGVLALLVGGLVTLVCGTLGMVLGALIGGAGFALGPVGIGSVALSTMMGFLMGTKLGITLGGAVLCAISHRLLMWYQWRQPKHGVLVAARGLLADEAQAPGTPCLQGGWAQVCPGLAN
jgi:hypothetical protein